VGAETGLPYQRPPLSKAYLKATLPAGELLIKPENFYQAQAIDTRLGAVVASFCPDANELCLGSGERIAFETLILATGAVPRRLNVPGADLDGVHELRSRGDADNLAADLGPGQRLVIVGGGYVGLEVAASARHLGCEVVVLEREDRALARVASAELANFLVDHHRARGADIITGAAVVSLRDRGDGTVAAVCLADGRDIACDAVVVGVGATPSDELASGAGLTCDGGVVVDRQARTSQPHVYAIGDATRRPLHHYEGRFRLESIPSTVEQAKQAVAAILGNDPPRPEVPWFWSDQYDAKIKIAGLLLEVDETVMRGTEQADRLALFHLRGSRVVAVETVNANSEFMAGKKLIETRVVLESRQLADPSIPLRDLLHQDS
jgi:3-phenylpropionate/trans-cinnamate dioxygenase ferredoxin reductase subunit